MRKRDIAGILVASVLLLSIGIARFERQHAKKLDAQCIFNLIIIDAAKQQWALESFAQTDPACSNAVPTPEIISLYNSRNEDPMPICPRGGTYKIGRVADVPACSFPGHVLGSNTSKWPDEFNITQTFPQRPDR